MSAPRKLVNRADGAALAQKLLSQLEADSTVETNDGVMCRCTLEVDSRPKGKPQWNIVLEYLDAIDAAGSRAAREGFAAVLTDFIASSIEGVVPDAKVYKRLIRSA